MQFLIALLGVVVVLLESHVGLLVARCILQDDRSILRVQFEHLRCVEDTGIAVQLSLFVEHERRFGRVLDGTYDLFLEHRDRTGERHVQRIVAVHQTVRHNTVLDLFQLRREATQRFDQPCISGNLKIQQIEHPLVRTALLVVRFVFGTGFLQRIRHVERHVLMLRVEHDRLFVGLDECILHLLMPACVCFIEIVLIGRQLEIGRSQFVL